MTKFLASGGFSDVYLAQRGDVGGFAAVKVGKQYITLKDEKATRGARSQAILLLGCYLYCTARIAPCMAEVDIRYLALYT